MDESVITTMPIGNKHFRVEVKDLRVSDLKFYSRNPRVYNTLQKSGIEEPDQETIFKCMRDDSDHVKNLRLSIETNGGLLTPLIVYNNIVLEGNSRLAAYRILCQGNPVKWGLVRCNVIIDTLTDDDIFNLLTSHHINARKDWSPIEQGGFLYRRTQESKRPIEDIAERSGIALSEVKRLVGTYELMVKNNDLEPQQWSYYEELWKNSGIKKKTEAEPEQNLFNHVMAMIKQGEIGEAKDIRAIGALAKSDDKESKEALDGLIKGTTSVEDAIAVVQEKGGVEKATKQLTAVRTLLLDPEFGKMAKDSKEIQFLLKKISKLLNDILK